MATLPQLQAAPDDAGAAPPDDQQPPEQGAPDDQAQPSGGDPKQMVGYIDPSLPPKVRVYLKAAAQFLIRSPSPEEASLRLKKVLSSSNDHIKALAYYVEKIIQQLETRLGPLSDQEHDQVAFFIAGWIVSTMQAWGMPGLDDAGARQHMIGQILQALDGLTKGAPGQQQDQQPPAPDAAAPPPQAGPPPGAPPPQMGV